jgi:diguanylate cyclase (GGDEF)-like protein
MRPETATQRGSADNETPPVGPPLFDGVTPALVSAMIAGGRARTLQAGEQLLRTGAVNTTLYVIRSGSLTVQLPDEGRPHLRFGPGDCVGELSVLDGQRVSADVVAESPAEVLGLDRDHVWALIDQSPEAARNLLRILAGRIRWNGAQLANANRRWLAVEQMATVDELTGLRNRRWLDDAFARCVTRSVRAGTPLTLLMIDIDHFKHVNDRHGHQAGDRTLRAVAQTLASALRPQDLVARYGGEEFAALLPDVPVQDAQTIAERLRSGVERASLRWPIPVTVSIGAAALEPADALEQLVARADRALYRAKRAGRNRVRLELESNRVPAGPQ